MRLISAALASIAVVTSAVPAMAREDRIGAADGAANTLAIVAAAPTALAAADTLRRSLAADRALHVVIAENDFAATDCSQKPYAAVLRVTREAADSGVDIGLELLDCAGWSVDQWHEQGSDQLATALAALLRFRTWMLEHPALAENVLRNGIPLDPQRAAPTYFYTLFKTSDGYMRALVRPGGPAWLAGLRTGDIVDKIDGRFWWEYGTYQTQLRAYDGKPHTFEVTRAGKPAIRVALGAPFVDATQRS